ncbi:hypothetical protein LJB85_00175 [Porphyromonadaceae bacterium OttesenSCG-928-L07]|nr:hypothetical protein [Porphyromonadaceae bacterium OttesenSCG-928-L07]MDL2251671.1 hypothetical protein [Odoribacter sp. OttesenSCG-928-J03]
MRSFFIAFILFTLVACSKDDELLFFTPDGNAPFDVPLMAWEQDTAYILHNLPEGYESYGHKEEEGIIRLFTVNYNRGNEAHYYFKSNRLEMIKIPNTKEEQLIIDCIDYFTRHLGQPEYMDDKAIWATKQYYVIVSDFSITFNFRYILLMSQ